MLENERSDRTAAAKRRDLQSPDAGGFEDLKLTRVPISIEWERLSGCSVVSINRHDEEDHRQQKLYATWTVDQCARDISASGSIHRKTHDAE